MNKTKTYPAKDEVPQMVDKIAAMKSYERARADVEAYTPYAQHRYA